MIIEQNMVSSWGTFYSVKERERRRKYKKKNKKTEILKQDSTRDSTRETKSIKDLMHIKWNLERNEILLVKNRVDVGVFCSFLVLLADFAPVFQRG